MDRPSLRAFWADRALPWAETGPVECAALARFRIAIDGDDIRILLRNSSHALLLGGERQVFWGGWAEVVDLAGRTFFQHANRRGEFSVFSCQTGTREEGTGTVWGGVLQSDGSARQSAGQPESLTLIHYPNHASQYGNSFGQPESLTLIHCTERSTCRMRGFGQPESLTLIHSQVPYTRPWTCFGRPESLTLIHSCCSWGLRRPGFGRPESLTLIHYGGKWNTGDCSFGRPESLTLIHYHRASGR